MIQGVTILSCPPAPLCPGGGWQKLQCYAPLPWWSSSFVACGVDEPRLPSPTAAGMSVCDAPVMETLEGRVGWTDGLITPSATLTGLSKPLASSHSTLALPPHKWVFCFSDISTDFPVANSKPLVCHLPCAHPNAQRPERGSPLSRCYSISKLNSIVCLLIFELYNYKANQGKIFFKKKKKVRIEMNFHRIPSIPTHMVNLFFQDFLESLGWSMVMPE